MDQKLSLKHLRLIIGLEMRESIICFEIYFLISIFVCLLSYR